MPRLIQASEATASRRRVYFQIVATDGITSATGEAGGQPQISSDGGAWTDTGIGVLVAVGRGRYYADLTAGAVATVGTLVETRYQSASTAECPGDTALVVAFDPYVVGLVPATITFDSPATLSGDAAVFGGDDYYTADGRAFSWTNPAGTWPNLTGAAIAWVCRGVSVAGSVVTPVGSGQQVRVEVPRTSTAALVSSLGAGYQPFRVVATLASGHVVTLVSRTVSLK